MAGRLVTIATFDELVDAHTAKGALEAAGIQMHLDNEQASSLFGQVMLPIGIRLVVREEDELQAVKVLDETFGTNEPVDEADLAALAEASEPEDLRDAAQQMSAPGADSVTDSDRDKNARVAFQAAVIGTIVPVVALFASVPVVALFASIFALIMIQRTAAGSGELSSRGKWNLRAAIVLVIPLVMTIVAAFLIAFVWIILIIKDNC